MLFGVVSMWLETITGVRTTTPSGDNRDQRSSEVRNTQTSLQESQNITGDSVGGTYTNCTDIHTIISLTLGNVAPMDVVSEEPDCVGESQGALRPSCSFLLQYS